MMRIIALLVAANLFLNGLVLVVVVTEDPGEEPTDERSSRFAGAAAGSGRAELAALRVQVRSLEREVRSIRRDVGGLEAQIREVLVTVGAPGGSAADRTLPLDGAGEGEFAAPGEGALDRQGGVLTGPGSERTERDPGGTGGTPVESGRPPPPVDDRHLDLEFSALPDAAEEGGYVEETGVGGGDDGEER